MEDQCAPKGKRPQHGYIYRPLHRMRAAHITIGSDGRAEIKDLNVMGVEVDAEGGQHCLVWCSERQRPIRAADYGPTGETLVGLELDTGERWRYLLHMAETKLRRRQADRDAGGRPPIPRR